ncbi:hypothetical protein NG796_10035 [Laspinema sp. A4]|nr:hypothetical protein [Laspinema sp. D2d]
MAKIWSGFLHWETEIAGQDSAKKRQENIKRKQALVRQIGAKLTNNPYKI